MAFKKESKKDWLQMLIIFMLGILLATSVFLFLELNNTNTDVLGLENEIQKLKADDLALAQVINNLLSQLEAKGVILPPTQP